MQERMRILNMLKSGKISEVEASKLLDAIGDNNQNNTFDSNESKDRPVPVGNLTGKLCIEINSHDADKVMVKIPLKLAPLALKMVPQSAKEQIRAQHGIDISELLGNLDAIAAELDEDLVNIESKEGDRVRIYIKR